MRTAGAVIAAAAIAGSLAFTVSASAAPAGQTPTQKTCAAFKAWDGKRTTAHFNTMVIDSLYAPAHYLGSDVLQLAADVRGGAAIKYINKDIKYVKEDCES